MGTTVEILENTTEISLVERDMVEIDISENVTVVEINNLAIPQQAAEVNDLTAAVTWADVPDANITESSVVQHQAALSISETQISDLQAYLTSVSANIVSSLPSGSVSATNVQDALNQLANQQFSQASAPSGVLINEGDFWYETDTETLYVYREVSPNVFNWVPISFGTGDSDTLDGGSY